MTTTPAVRTYTTQETAVELRNALHEAFPGVKFSVRIAPGAAWIYLHYVDGPVWDDVERIASRFEAGDDGDLAESRYLCRGVSIGRDYTEAAKDWAARIAIEGTHWYALGEQYGTGNAAAYHGSHLLLAATDLTRGTPGTPPCAPSREQSDTRRH